MDWVNTWEMGLRDWRWLLCCGLVTRRESNYCYHRMSITSLVTRTADSKVHWLITITDDHLAKSGRRTLDCHSAELWKDLVDAYMRPGVQQQRRKRNSILILWKAYAVIRFITVITDYYWIFSFYSAAIKRQNCSKILHFFICLFNSMSYRNSAELSWAVHPIKLTRFEENKSRRRKFAVYGFRTGCRRRSL